MTASDTPEGASFLPAIESMARQAGEVTLRHFRRLSGYEKKGALDLVTAADTASEEVIVGEIRRQFPDYAILAEEGGRTGNAESEFLWVVDPLDGTTNFAHGLPLYSVSIALLHRGEIIAGGVFAPAMGEMYLAARGHGATRNGEPIRVSSVDQLGDAMIVERVERALAHAQGLLRLGSAALDFSLVAAGHIDVFYEANLKPWDMAAGVLLVREAGGRVTALDGGEFDLFAGEMLTTNGPLHPAMIPLVK
jgi:myo-inositol-1(or 4)-monophosphatase